YFKKEKFDIVHTHTPKPGLLGQMAARLAGVPIVVNTIHGLYFGNKFSKAKSNFYILIEKISAKFSNLIFSQNKEDIITMINEKIANPKIIKYLGNGINLERFNKEGFSQDFINNKRKEIGIPKDYKVIGAVGRLVKEKGYLELFSAFEKVLEIFPKTLLLVIGPEDSEKNDSFDKSIVKNYKIKDNVIFLGERTDTEELFLIMDVFVLASHREGFPRTVIEAMAENVPVITTDIRGCREIIENKKSGILVQLGDSKEIAEQIIFLFKNPEVAKEMTEVAKIEAVKNFDEKLVFEKIKKEYDRLLKKDILPRRLKVCHVTTVDITVRFIILNFLKFLKSKSYDVSVVCSLGKWVPFLEKEGFFIHNIKMTRRITLISDLISLIKLFFYFKKEKFDIVHTHTPKAGILGRIAAKLAGVPVVIHTNHGLYLYKEWALFRRSIFIFFEKVAAYCSDMIFSVNREDINTAIKEKICGPEKIKYSSEGIDIKRFDPKRFSVQDIMRKKNEIGIDLNSKVIGIVGRLVIEKGYADIFEAFKIISKKFPGSTLMIIGQEEKEKEDSFNLEYFVKKFQINKNVIFLGERTDVDELYALMDVFVLPSHREGLGLVILEASAMEKPVVATDIRGCREAVDNGKAGILVPAKKPTKLSDAIIFLLENPEKAKQMGESGRRRVAEEFDEIVVFEKMEKEYKRLINR
ncbi:MAG: glycosyltransferase family 4 protein, partial [Candidatus Gracilibacteria bacterium]